jgi:hypothetical protein
MPVDKDTGSKTQIIIAIISVVGVLGGALIANWNNIFPPPQPKPPTEQAGKYNPPSPFDVESTKPLHPDNKNVDQSHPEQPISGGPIVVTATANPPVVSRGQETTINVYVQDSKGKPLPSATVTLSSGGGRFRGSGTTTVAGETDSSGAFQGYWSCDNCAAGYIGDVRVTKPGYEEAKFEWRVEIH